MNENLSKKLASIDEKKLILDSFRPLPKGTVEALREKLSLDWIYNSNAIEGNTLTLRETKVVLEGIAIGGKTMSEHFEAINHRDAIFFVEDIVSKNEEISEWQIKNIHSLVLSNIGKENAGRYRRENVMISGASTTPPDFFRINEEMDLLLDWHKNNFAHPIARAAEMHALFVKIHPFIDGNGRTGRLLLNLELMKDGYPVAIIRKEDRLDYYNSLDSACLSADFDGITNLVADAVNRSMDIYLGSLPAKNQDTDQESDSGPNY